jgi:hypothetical protein
MLSILLIYLDGFRYSESLPIGVALATNIATKVAPTTNLYLPQLK